MIFPWVITSSLFRLKTHHTHIWFSSTFWSLTKVCNPYPQQPSCRLSASHITHHAKLKRTSSVGWILFNDRWRKKTHTHTQRDRLKWTEATTYLRTLLRPNQKAQKIFHITFEILWRETELKLYEAMQRYVDSSRQAFHSCQVKTSYIWILVLAGGQCIYDIIQWILKRFHDEPRVLALNLWRSIQSFDLVWKHEIYKIQGDTRF